MFSIIKKFNDGLSNHSTFCAVDEAGICIFKKKAYAVDSSVMPPLINELPDEVFGSFSISDLNAEIQRKENDLEAMKFFMYNRVPSNRISRYAFISRFTDEEFYGLVMQADVNPLLKVFVKKLDYSTEVNLNLPATIEGVQMLANGGLIAASRVAEILAI